MKYWALTDVDELDKPLQLALHMMNDRLALARSDQLKLDSGHHTEFAHPSLLSESDGDCGWNHRRSSDASNLSSHRRRFTSGNSRKSGRVRRSWRLLLFFQSVIFLSINKDQNKIYIIRLNSLSFLMSKIQWHSYPFLISMKSQLDIKARRFQLSNG